MENLLETYTRLDKEIDEAKAAVAEATAYLESELGCTVVRGIRHPSTDPDRMEFPVKGDDLADSLRAKLQPKIDELGQQDIYVYVRSRCHDTMTVSARSNGYMVVDDIAAFGAFMLLAEDIKEFLLAEGIKE